MRELRAREAKALSDEDYELGEHGEDRERERERDEFRGESIYRHTST